MLGLPLVLQMEIKTDPFAPSAKYCGYILRGALPPRQVCALTADVIVASTLALVLPSVFSTPAGAGEQSSLALPAPFLVHAFSAARALFLKHSSHLATPRLTDPPWLSHLQNQVGILGTPHYCLC